VRFSARTMNASAIPSPVNATLRSPKTRSAGEHQICRPLIRSDGSLAAFDRRKLEDARPAPQLAEIKARAASAKAAPRFADVLTCLPATLIARAVQTASGPLAIGGEDCSTDVAGAFTGYIGTEMLKSAAGIRPGGGHRRTLGTPPASRRDGRRAGGESESRTARDSWRSSASARVAASPTAWTQLLSRSATSRCGRSEPVTCRPPSRSRKCG
jgi:hypothetical protein